MVELASGKLAEEELAGWVRSRIVALGDPEGTR
jgi:hypothetical protein